MSSPVPRIVGGQRVRPVDWSVTVPPARRGDARHGPGPYDCGGGRPLRRLPRRMHVSLRSIQALPSEAAASPARFPPARQRSGDRAAPAKRRSVRPAAHRSQTASGRPATASRPKRCQPSATRRGSGPTHARSPVHPARSGSMLSKPLLRLSDAPRLPAHTRSGTLPMIPGASLAAGAPGEHRVAGA